MSLFDVSGFVYAHRGLWGAGAPENSLAAFHAARQARVGVELDVRLTRDGGAVVFHDATLERMCGIDARLADVSLEDLEGAFLPDGSPVPTLEQALGVMEGLPVLIELKVDPPDSERIADAVAGILRGREGQLAVMSFDEASVSRSCQIVSKRPVGLLIDTLERVGAAGIAAKAARARAMGCDFIGPHHSSLETASGASGGLPLVTWTVRNADEVALAHRHRAAPIFEGFSADLAKGAERPI